MRVLFVTHAYPRWDGDVAGAFIERLALALVQRGHAISVVAPSDRGQGGEETRRGVQVRRVRYASVGGETLAYRGTMLRALRSPRGLLAFAAMLRSLSRAVRTSEADVVHAHWWVPAGVAASRGAVVPYVVTLHGTDVTMLRKLKPLRPLARRVLERAAQVTAVSKFLAGRATEWTGYHGACLVQPMPVEVPHREVPGGGGVVTVGRLSRQKRTRLVLEAMAKLQRDGVRVPLTVIGDGPERPALERQAEALGIAGTTRFRGSVEPEALPQALEGADVMAFPAKHEGFGLAAAEALLLGIPVVAMEDGGGALDIVPRTGGGRVVSAGDGDALAAGIREILQDADARRAAQAQGERLRTLLDPAAAAAQFEACYTAAIRNRAAS